MVKEYLRSNPFAKTRIWIGVVFLLAVSASAWAAGPYEVAVERNLEAKMRDGIVLRTDVYRPKGEGEFPVLLERTPYNKDGSNDFALTAARNGYIVVIQDVRGRYTSDGEWYTFRNEPNDGYDTVEWAAALPHSNGKVGMFGGSYVGATQMLAAITHPPHLAGICPEVTASNYHNGWTYQAGAFEQWFNESWTSILAQDTYRRAVERRTLPIRTIARLPLAGYQPFLPGGPESDSASTLAPYFLDWLAHPDYDGYWKQWSIEEHYADIRVPALTIAAWYDIFLGGSLRNYQGMKEHGGDAAARQGQRLLVMIGGHAGDGRKIGDVDFGPEAELTAEKVTLDWYNHLFKNEANEFASAKRVKLFVMGANQWREEDDWPLKGATNTKYFLHSAGKANSLRGEGSLSLVAPRTEAQDQLIYDPANPAPTIGGPLCCDGAQLAPGPRDQRAVESRNDVLVYSTPPMAEDMEVTGPVSLELFAKSTAVDTDFTAKLVDVWPNGFAQNLTEGIIRARYRDSQEKPELMNPGQIYNFHLDLWATSNVFRKGHILRLEVSSSNFPRFDRNLNTGTEAATGEQFVSAANTIYHDAEHPSVLVLPLVKRP